MQSVDFLLILQLLFQTLYFRTQLGLLIDISFYVPLLFLFKQLNLPLENSGVRQQPLSLDFKLPDHGL